MTDWKRAVERRITGLSLDPVRRMEIVEELAQHLADRHGELRARGVTEPAARREVIAELEAPGFLADRLDSVERAVNPEPTVTGAPPAPWISTLPQDVRYGVRTLRHSPGFAAVAILTLALGIGATTAIFSVMDAVMLRPYPYADMDRIMILSEITRSGQGLSIAWPNYQDWRDQNEVFEHFGVYRGATVNITGGDRAERLNGSTVSSAVFKAVGIQAQAGRVFLPEDDQPTASRVAVISDRLWRNRFNADPAIVGREVVLNNQTHTIVGVAPPGMRFPSRLTDVWLPLGLAVSTFPTARGSHPGLTVVAKLKPGVTLEQANANMDAIARRLEKAYPLSNTDHTASITPYYEQIVSNIRPALVTLVVAVGFVLLIACANLATLLLARSDRLQHEIAIRAALGASRFRIFQQLLIENLLLSVAGGAIGSLLAVWAVRVLVAMRPATIPRIDLVAVDGRVLLFTAALSILTGMIFGLLPALRASAPDLQASLKGNSRSTTASGRRLRSALVVVEVALAVVLLVGAGLTLKSFSRLTSVDLGFNPDHVITMRVTLPNAKYPELASWLSFHQELVRRVGALPALDAVALNSAVPLEGGGSESEVLVEGQPLVRSPREMGTMCVFQATTPDYFRAMSITLTKGRFFTDRDTAESVQVAIVDESLVRRLFPNTDPIGKRIAFEFRGHGPENPDPIWREIIGVVGHVRHYGLVTEPPYVQVYTPLPQIPIWFRERRPSMALIARTLLDAERVAASIREELGAIDRDIPLYGIQTMDSYVAQTTEQPRLSMALLAAFATLALLLAVVGIYGVLSYLVRLRTQEIGIRMALGATRGNVLRSIVGHGLALTGAGLVFGLVGSWWLATSLEKFLFEVSPHDAGTFGAIAMLLSLVACVASYLPGRRATRVNPIAALRAE